MLFWHSVRPVPTVTIEFGDGRTLKRTLTGNSCHYVLDAQGRPIDALPGLYGAKAFVAGLDRAAEVATRCAPLDEKGTLVELQKYHAARADAIRRQWQEDLEKIGALPSRGNREPASATISRVTTQPAAVQPALIPSPATLPTTTLSTTTVALKRSAPAAPSERPPQVVAANAIAAPKGAAETRILAAALADPRVLQSASTEEVWSQLAQLHAADAELDQASWRFIASQNPTAGRAAEVAVTKRFVAAEEPLIKLVRTLQHTIAIDTVRNEYQLHRQIHEWFAANPAAQRKLMPLNERVYAELFLTPTSDQWYGLLPSDGYTGLDDNGVCFVGN